MKKQTILIDAKRCLMCHQPRCNEVCPDSVFPAGIIHALLLENDEGAKQRIHNPSPCLHCEKAPCEKACARGRIDQAVRIREICRTLSTEENRTSSGQQRKSGNETDLSVDFCGVHCPNPFFLASSPVASSLDMCRRAFDAGWAGIAYKTISFYQSKEVSPRFDIFPARKATAFGGFKNLEQLSPHPAEEDFEILFRLKQEYPENIVIASIMGQSCEEWTRLARMAQEAGADMVECNFSCPQMAKQGLGSDIGQDPELISLYTQAVRKGCTLPIIAKMTPNVGNMEIPATAAVSNGADALAAINTVKSITRINPENFSSYPDIEGFSSVGGYSGRAVKPIALRFIRDMAVYPPLQKIPLFGIGGITTWRDALDFLLLGCTAVQVCTSVMEYGYRIVEHLKEGLSLYMRQNGFESVSELRGKALEHIVPPEQLNRERKLCSQIDPLLCIGCGRCHVSCLDGGHQAILWKGRKPEIMTEKCVGCGLCQLVCPSGACRLKTV